MAEWLEQASQWHGMFCHDLELMSSNPGRVEFGVRSTSVLSRTWTKDIICYILSHNQIWAHMISSLNAYLNP